MHVHAHVWIHMPKVISKYDNIYLHTNTSYSILEAFQAFEIRHVEANLFNIRI
jgi:hypothetical protein